MDPGMEVRVEAEVEDRSRRPGQEVAFGGTGR